MTNGYQIGYERSRLRLTLIAVYTPDTHSCFLMSFPAERSQGSLEKWLISGTGEQRYKMSLEHLNVSRYQRKYFLKNDGGMSEKPRSLKRLSLAKSGAF